MNVLLTDLCNRKCSFCFADLPANPSAIKYMSLENLRHVFAFLKKSNISEFRCIGGEPTLHPKFIEFLEEAIQQKFSILLFSNGVVSKRKTDFLHSLAQLNALRILCNVSECAADTKAQLQQRDYFLRTLASKIRLSVTVDRPDFKYEYLLEILDKYPVHRRIRLGIAHPVYRAKTNYLRISDFVEYKKTFNEFEKCLSERNAQISLDCGFPSCLLNGYAHTTSKCTPIIDVGVDLTVWSCFPLRHMNPKNLSDFQDYSHAYNYFTNKLNALNAIPLMSACIDCDIRKLCNQGCKAHRLQSGT